jgi:hypothetical protein
MPEAIDRSPPIAFFLLGQAYFNTARHAHRARCEGELKWRFDEVPIYYLYSHTIELTLKGFLRARGLPAGKLRDRERYGHSLQKLWDECLARDLVVDAADMPIVAEVIKLLDPYATNFEFRYIRLGAGLR